MWYLANPVLAQGDMSKPGGTVTIAASDSVVWVAEQAESSNRVFSAGDASDSTSWTGQVTFTSAPGSFRVEVGSADGDGNNFQPGGPEQTLAGIDATVFTYVTNAAGFTVPATKHLALKIKNTSGSADTVRVGGAWSYCAGAAPPVRITVPEGARVPKDGWHNVPVSASEDLTDKGFTALQTVLTYDGTVIHPEDILTDGTMTEGWTVEFNVLPGASPDTFKIAMSTAADTLKGSGILFYIHVKAAAGASVGDQTTLHFESFRFNEDAPEEADTRDGTVYVEPPWLLGDVSDSEKVTAYDAALILFYVVGLADSAQYPNLIVEDGRILVSFAGAESGVGSGSVLEILLDARDADLLRSLRLDRVVLNEGMIPARIEGRDVETPGAYRLAQNYPNPFNPETIIRYDLPKAGPVRLAVYALTGQVVRTLVDGERPVGRHSVTWDGTDNASRNVASGVYLYRMDAGDFRAVRKLVLVR